MVSEGGDTVMSACADFTQNAWKKDLCVNCQRPRGEHSTVEEKESQGAPNAKNVQQSGIDSPKPAKRNSLMTKSWTVIQADDKSADDNEDDKWNSMCLPDPEHPNKPLDDHNEQVIRRDHCYEDIDGESLKQGQSSNGGESSKNLTKSSKTGVSVSKLADSLRSNIEDRSRSFIAKDGNTLTGNRDSSSRSRSSSRDKSPAPALKPKPADKLQNKDKTKTSESITDKPKQSNDSENLKPQNVSPRSRKKLKRGQKSLSFVEDPPEVIGNDGGIDNLYSDQEEEMQDDDNDTKEIMKFSENEKEWALQSLKNTIWNTEHLDADKESRDKDKKSSQSKEYEDLQMENLLKPDRFANVRDCDPLPERQDFGTFPLRTKTEKSAMDSLFSGNRLSTLSESAENTYNAVDDSQEKYESVMKFLGAGNVDLSLSPKHKSSTETNADELQEQNYDDPWGDKFGLDTESEMNLFDEIRSEIDLDSSTAGFALVDLLNDVLAKYSSETPSETDSLKNFDFFDDDKTEKGEKKKPGSIKSAELEAKMVTLAASLRAKKAKGRAPRPPSCPPEPPPDTSSVSPTKQLELRAAQSKEPTFKMVPIGKPIGSNPLSQSAPAPSSSPQKAETLPSSTSSPENMEGYKVKGDNKEKQKKGGGFGSFFSRFLRRGRDSESDLTTSSDTLVSNGSLAEVHSDSDSQSDNRNNSYDKKTDKGDNLKADKRSSKSSPQMKLKVLPGRPISPKPPDKPPHRETSKENEKESKSSQKSKQATASPAAEPKLNVKDSQSTEDTDKNSSPKINQSKENVSKNQLSPTKSFSKEHLATSPKAKEAPPLPLHPPRDVSDSLAGPPKPRPRGNSEGGVPRSRPRTRDLTDGKPRDTPNAPPPKPPVAMKPRPPAVQTKSADIVDNSGKSATTSQPQKEHFSSSTSLDEEVIRAGKASGEPQKSSDPKILRKRAKSPKRFAAPTAPGRSSMPNILSDSNTSLASNTSEPSAPPSGVRLEPKGLSFSKELELKLTKDQGQPSPSVTTETRKLSAPPPPPLQSAKPDYSEKSKTLPKDNTKTLTKDKDIPKSSPKDSDRLKSLSKDELKTSPPTEDSAKPFTASENDVSQVQTSDIPFQPEKIELPRPVGSSRKSFLGKLNRSKNKPPPPPSVKRTKSITESSMHGDSTLKKIDLKDISGPVLITDMSSNKVVNRRNTISLGDDNPFLSGGSTSSGSTSAGEKSDLSPRGSVENLYEFITSEAPTPPTGDKKNLYDPVVENTIGLRPPSICGSEGYLEPVRSNSGVAMGESVKSNMADSTISIGSMTTSLVSMVNNMTAMSKSVCEESEAPTVTNINPEIESMDISDERRELLASQPIYEEINGYGKLSGSKGNENENLPNQIEDTPGFEEEAIYGVGGDAPSLHQAQLSGPVQDLTNMLQNPPSLPTLKSKDSFSSDSDVSASNSLSRPRPIPRKRPRQVGSGFEQYVAMNRPSVAVFLNEEMLREMLSRLTAMNLQTLREIYTQHEKCFTKENLQLGAVGPLKWHDFNIYGKPLHTSEKCVVYNAKLKSTVSPCQVMLLHSRPEITSANHPSLLKPTCIFTDSIPFSYLTDEFIHTSQILQTCVNQSNSNLAKCYVVVGLFDITESLNNHLRSLETICDNQKDFLQKVLFFVLQLLSAISHCLEQGHPLAEADFHDLYLISNPYCLGETVSFLPQLRAPGDEQIETVCQFLEKFLQEMCVLCDATSVLDDSAFFTFTGIQRVVDLLQSEVAECLPVVRSYTEFLLWGPDDSASEFREDRQSNIEPKLSMWLEKQRADLIHDFAKRVQHGARCNIRDFYKMKFLLKASSGSLAECIRCHMSGS